MVIEAPYVARKCEPGQFIILRVNSEGERIPLTIQDFDRERGTVSVIYQIVGYSTALLSRKKAGDTIEDFVGPLGLPTRFKEMRRVIGIGGGVGTAPLFPQLRELKNRGVAVDVIIGGRSKEFLLLEDELREFCDNVYCTTDDGSQGEKGLVTDKLKALLEAGEKYDEVIAIGPLIMMKFVSLLTKEWSIPTSVSLNPIMIDGTGMCGGCRVTVGGKTKFACVDGPDFDGHQVDFNELIRRGRMYHEEEEHKCKIDPGE